MTVKSAVSEGEWTPLLDADRREYFQRVEDSDGVRSHDSERHGECGAFSGLRDGTKGAVAELPVHLEEAGSSVQVTTSRACSQSEMSRPIGAGFVVSPPLPRLLSRFLLLHHPLPLRLSSGDSGVSGSKLRGRFVLETEIAVSWLLQHLPTLGHRKISLILESFPDATSPVYS